MEFIKFVPLLSVVINCVVLLLLLFLSKDSLKRIKNVIDILESGGYRQCPFFREVSEKGGKRWYDEPAQCGINPDEGERR